MRLNAENTIQAREIIKTREQLNRIYADRTGQSVERIAADMERDFWMTAEEAKKYGLVDKIIDTRKLADQVQKSA